MSTPHYILRTVACPLLALSLLSTRAAAQDEPPRTPLGRPNLSGIWQALGSHHWNLEPHTATHGPVVELGALGAIPAGLGVVETGRIPYTPGSRATQQDNARHWLTRDPAVVCNNPGIPRATYMPYPFQIVQTPTHILFDYEFANASRAVYMNPSDIPTSGAASPMGQSRGSWEDDTLVVEVLDQTPDSWLDSNGNYYSNQFRVVERYTPITTDHLLYEATIYDPVTYARPWTVRLPLYRHIDDTMRLQEFNCVEFAFGTLEGAPLGVASATPPVFRATGYGFALESEQPVVRRSPDPAEVTLTTFASRYRGRDAGVIAQLFSERAMLTPPATTRSLSGKTSITSYYEALFSQPDELTLSIQQITVARPALPRDRDVTSARYVLSRTLHNG